MVDFPWLCQITGGYIPEKFNMEPKKHPSEKENHLPNLVFFRFHVNLPGEYTHIFSFGVWMSSGPSQKN